MMNEKVTAAFRFFIKILVLMQKPCGYMPAACCRQIVTF